MVYTGGMTTTVNRRPGRSVPVDPARLRRARQERGWTITELAGRVRKSSSLVSAAETGACGLSPDTAREFAKALRVPLRDLLTDREA